VLYGFQHQRSITSQAKAAHAQAEYQHKADLIQKAKLEWAKKTLPPESKTASGDSVFPKLLLDMGKANVDPSVISDPNDKNFDLEAYLTKLSAES
jgi:F-type H+-transporting ATP synthase subunit e